MSQYANTEAAFREVGGPEVAPWSPTPGSDARPPVGVGQRGVADPAPMVDINRIRDDFMEELNRGADNITVPVPGVYTDSGKTAEVTVPLPWSDSRRKEQTARLERWLAYQERLGQGLFAGEAATIQQQLDELTEEGRRYEQALRELPETEEDAGTYSYESYSHPLDDLDRERHRAENSWTRRVAQLNERLDEHLGQLELGAYNRARVFYMMNPAAAQRARDILFGADDFELPSEEAVPAIEPLDLNLMVHRTQKMVNKREKVRRSLYERDMIRTDGTPVDTNTYPAFRDRV
jgi:hypothetical protein